MTPLKTLLVSSLTLSLLLTGCSVDSDDAAALSPGSGESTAVNSSYARLIAVGNYLYGVTEQELVTFNATDPSNPEEIDRQDVGLDIETIYHLNGTLFIGSQQAMYTYTIDVGGIPRRRGLFDYNFTATTVVVQPCDPVVVSDDIAYITLYSEQQVASRCGSTTEFIELLVLVDVSNLDAPELIDSFEVPTPRGLAVDGDLLFVCNDWSGLTVYDITERRSPTLIGEVPTHSFDAVAIDGLLIVVGPQRLTQFEYTPDGTLTELGTIDL